jgi:hypothetical protein
VSTADRCARLRHRQFECRHYSGAVSLGRKDSQLLMAFIFPPSDNRAVLPKTAIRFRSSRTNALNPMHLHSADRDRFDLVVEDDRSTRDEIERYYRKDPKSARKRKTSGATTIPIVFETWSRSDTRLDLEASGNGDIWISHARFGEANLNGKAGPFTF